MKVLARAFKIGDDENFKFLVYVSLSLFTWKLVLQSGDLMRVR